MRALAAKASLAASNTQNIRRNIRRFALKGTKYPKPFWIKVPFVHPKTGAELEMDFPLLLPHE
eukprot:4137690-Amphidinium_carterae.1